MGIIPNKNEWRNFWKAVDEYMQAYPVEPLFAISFIAFCMLLILLAFFLLVFGLWKLCMYFIRINR